MRTNLIQRVFAVCTDNVLRVFEVHTNIFWKVSGMRPGVFRSLFGVVANMVRALSAATRVIVRTVFESGAVQQTVSLPFGLIEDSQFHRLLDDPQKCLFGGPEQRGEYLGADDGYVLSRQDVAGDAGFLSVQECVHIGLIGFRRRTGDFDVKGVRVGPELFEQSPVGAHPFGTIRCPEKVQSWIVLR